MGRRGRPSALARMSVGDLMRELDRRRGMLNSLHARRQEMEGELQSMATEIADLESLGGGGGGVGGAGHPRVGRPRGRKPGRPRGSGGGGGGGGGRRGRGANQQSLAQALHGILQGKTLSVGEMSDAVQKAGYKTKSPNFRTIVNASLLAKPNRSLFRKVARGQYTAK